MKKHLLFTFQIIMAWFYVVPQILKILEGETKGLNLAMYVNFLIYNIFSLFLAVAALSKSRDVIRKQTVFVFSQWAILNATFCIVGFNKMIWRPGDTIISFVIVMLSILTILYYRGIENPMSKGFLTVWFKSVPQFWLACTIYSVGNGSGLPLMTLVAGHLTGIPRFAQVVWSGIRGGWDTPTKGLLLGESINVITWVLVTIVWSLYL